MGFVTDHHQGVVESGKPPGKTSHIVERKESVHGSTEGAQFGVSIEKIGRFARAFQGTVPDLGYLAQVARLKVFTHRMRLPASPAAEGTADILLLTDGVSVAHEVKDHRYLVVVILPVRPSCVNSPAAVARIRGLAASGGNASHFGILNSAGNRMESKGRKTVNIHRNR